MRSFKILVAVPLAALTLLAPGAALLEDLFPAKTGASWSFSGTAGQKPFNPTCKVVSAKNEGGKKVVVMEWTSENSSIQTETFWITQQDVRRVTSGRGGATRIEPPVPIIKYPMAVGKSWTWKGTINSDATSIPATATLKVTGQETVKSSAGTFKAYRVDMTLTLQSGAQSMTIPNTYWFAPGKGMVKQSAVVMGTKVEATATKIAGL